MAVAVESALASGPSDPAPGGARRAVVREVLRAAVSEGFISVAADRVSILSEDTFLADEIDEAATTAELEKARSSEDELAVRRAEAKLRLIGKAS